MARGSSVPRGKTKAQRVAEEVARAVGAGRAVHVETVDFNDPKRPKTCLEVDFPILPVNQVAIIEGNAGKPIYQMSKWWARRRSSVFRSLLLAASMKSPDDPLEAAKAVWDVYYSNHQKKRSFEHLKVADIFMGGGTTVVEGSRLGMQMFGNDLNPVAWFVVKTELAQVDKSEVEALLAAIKAEVKPQIMPFYECRGPYGERGKWTRISTGEVMEESFKPSNVEPEERKDFKYEGPEVIYVFWAKHGPCQVTGCGHLTPIVTSPVIAVKELTVKAWPFECKICRAVIDVENCEARMAPDSPLAIAPDEHAFAVLNKNGSVICPACGALESAPALGQERKKKVALSLLIHPQWLQGSPSKNDFGEPWGGIVTDDTKSAGQWHEGRAQMLRLLEVRGTLPESITCPETGVVFKASEGTVPKKSKYACGACGTVQDLLTTIEESGTAAPVASYAIQGWSAAHVKSGSAYGGRFFALGDASTMVAAEVEWGKRKFSDLSGYWPETLVEPGLETSVRTPLQKYGYRRWQDFFNSRQLLVHSLILSAIDKLPGHSEEVREAVLAAFQQFLRSNNMFSIWDINYDKLAPFLSKNNLQPPTRPVENSVFSPMGRGNWISCCAGVLEAISWREDPWDVVARQALPKVIADELGTSKSAKAVIGDAVGVSARLACQSSTALPEYSDGSFDLVITDPPFGDIMQYAELSGLFYAWQRLILGKRYAVFAPEQPPTALEAVENSARQGKAGASLYSRLLTACWQEAHRILRLGGILAFTFHHDKDEPWVAVLESLFHAGFYLEATYPVRSDETKGEGGTPGTFGAQKVEYDILHVCRKRTEDPTPVSWAKMRRQVLQDVRGLKDMLEHHQKAGLLDADLQVIRRGKALEYFSRHYGKVMVDDSRSMSVREALLGINQLLDEEAGGVKTPPPVTAEPFTRQFLRLFDGVNEVPRDQIQKFLRGTGISPSEFEARGWCTDEKKVYILTPPLEVARAWQGKHRRGMTSDYDQAAFFIGSCFENSGINASDTLTNDNFKPNPALGAVLEWFTTRGATSELRNAASRAQTILRSWRAKNEKQARQMSLFFDDQGAS
jgi:putative DNA methylase